MPSDNRVKNVAIVGAGGNCGRHIAEELIKGGKHTVTAITREDSKSSLPDGVHHIKQVNYSIQSTIVKALSNQDALVITMSGHAPKGDQVTLIKAAFEAGVAFILPNEWSPNTFNKALSEDVSVFGEKVLIRDQIIKLSKGKTSYIAVTTSFWYEWMLAMPYGYGFDFANKKVVFFDDGKTKINTSSLPQVGRGVAALLSLPIEAEGGDTTDGYLSHFKNSQVRISSFNVNQKDMLESILRVTGDNQEDWKTSYEPASERYSEGMKAMKAGDWMGFGRAMTARVFYKDGVGNFEKTLGTHNVLLGLPSEDIDEFTKEAIKRAGSKH